MRIKSMTSPPVYRELEEEIEETRRAKENAIEAQEFEKAANLRDKERQLTNKKRELEEQWESGEAEGQARPSIGEEEIADIVSMWTGIPVFKLTEAETAKLMRMEDELHKRVIGQHAAVAERDGRVRGHHERHGIQRVRGVRRAVRLEHVVRVAVIGGDHERTTGRLHRGDDVPEACVDGLDRRDRSADHAGVADHVGVGEVDDPEGGPVLAPAGDELLGNLPRAHLRLVVVGRHVAGARRQFAPLVREGSLFSAVEEVRHVRVLLGLGDVQLRASGRGDQLRERRLRPLRREGDGVVPLLVVLRQAGVARDRGAEGRRQLAHAVRAEIERDDGVLRADPRLRADRGAGRGSLCASAAPREKS